MMKNTQQNSVILVALAALLLVACGNEQTPRNHDSPGETTYNPVCRRSCQASECGTLSDGCGGILSCGGCPSGQNCGGGGTPNVCGEGECTPTVCMSNSCGTLSDGCSELLSCGGCPSDQSCGGGGRPNVCGGGDCTPSSCAALGANCGTHEDGCGGWLNCGSCSGDETCGGGGIPHVCGLPCNGQCPEGYSCVNNICRGGNAQQLWLDAKTTPFSGKVTLNGSNPVCSTGLRGKVVLTGNTWTTHTLDLQGCQAGTEATFSSTVFAGTYRVVVRGVDSDLPKADFVVHEALTLPTTQENWVLDVKAVPIAGKVTLNGSKPKSKTGLCYNNPRGKVVLTDTKNPAAAFTLDLEGCQVGEEASFSGTVFPGTYRVVVRGVNSDLPTADFVVHEALTLPTVQANLTLDVKTTPIAGKVTLDGSNPIGNHIYCSATNPRGRVVLTDTKNPAAAFTLDLEGCQVGTEATFSGTVFPGTYRAVVHGVASDLPNAGFLVNAALTLPTTQSNLTLDVKTVSVDGKVTLDGRNPIGASCSATNPRGRVVLTDTQNPAAVFTLDLEGCQAGTEATFSGVVFPGTYRAVVRGVASDLPKADFVANAALAIPTAQTNVVLDVKTVSIAGKMTLNGSNPISTHSSCRDTDRDSYSYRGVLIWIGHNVAASYLLPLWGCQAGTEATFAGTVFPDIYWVGVFGGVYSDIPGGTYGLIVPSLQVP